MGQRWRDDAQLRRHDEDVYSHGPALHPFDQRLTVLERFKAQATLLGGIALVVLGAVTAAVAARLLGAIH